MKVRRSIKGGRLTMDSHLKEVWRNPAGQDILKKVCLQMNVPAGVIVKGPLGNLTLRNLDKLTRGKLSKGFFDAFLSILNENWEKPIVQGRDTAEKGEGEKAAAPWWKTAVFYQIYPRSFCDSNRDGIGDLPGIISKLDYLKDLGVDALWLSPVYDSPNDDNGYDIRDYQNIMEEFGKLEDMERLISEVHKRGMRLIMDLVINHTSDEHKWFKEALKNEDSPYRDFYFFKKGKERPNNWTSFFEGSAWRYFEEENLWALHLFSSKQMDLNWDNEALRSQVISMIRWWLEKGVDGFRMDVINYISKREGLPNGDETIGQMMGYTGIEHYFYGPKLHQYLHQIRMEAFAPFDAFSVGETPGIGMEMAKKLTARSRQELDLIFNFDHLETPGHTRYDNYRYDLNYLKRYMIDWMENYGPQCHMSLFWDNHDNPRMISKVDPEGLYRFKLAKMLMLVQLTLKGTPFLYQGQEIGMCNQNFTSIEQLRDIEARNRYEKLCETMTAEEAFLNVLSGTRDHARVPMQWEEGAFGGFTKGDSAWMEGDGDYWNCNMEGQWEDDNSVLQFTRRLLALRREYPLFGLGRFRATNQSRKNLFTYYRYDKDTVFYVECNLGQKPLYVGKRPGNFILITSSYCQESVEKMLKPYEANLYRVVR